jgi:ABC-2 type transport system permease protein
MGLAAIFVLQGANLATIGVAMQLAPSLNGWRLPEVLLIYGLLIFSRSCSQLFTDRIWNLGSIIRQGGFDCLLLQPINPLFNLLANGFSWEGVGNLLLGGALVVSAGQTLGIFLSPFNIVYLALAVFSGAVIFFAINLITSVSAFWITDSTPVMGAVFETYLFAHCPLTIYPRAIRLMLTWLIPYGFVSFYPAAFLAGREVGLLAWMSPVIAIALLAVGYRLWLIGLARYDGAGS